MRNYIWFQMFVLICMVLRVRWWRGPLHYVKVVHILVPTWYHTCNGWKQIVCKKHWQLLICFSIIEKLFYFHYTYIFCKFSTLHYVDFIKIFMVMAEGKSQKLVHVYKMKVKFIKNILQTLLVRPLLILVSRNAVNRLSKM